MRFIVVCLTLFFSLAVSAEEFVISIEGGDISKLAAIEVKIALEPRKSLRVAESISVIEQAYQSNRLVNKVIDDQVLFKFANPVNNTLRVFFAKPPQAQKILLLGNLIRDNFSGKADVGIAKLDFISDFSKKADKDDFKVNIAVREVGVQLPFLGISKGEILGPKARMYSKVFPVSIGGLETYGFSLEGKIAKAKINDFAANIIDSKVIIADLELDESYIDKELPITLELEVDHHVVQKKLGVIKILEFIK